MNFQNFLNEAELQYWKKYINSNSMLKAAISVLNKIEKKGYKAFIVGGSVRDLILGVDPHDVDIATNCKIDILENLWKVHDIGSSRDFGIVTVTEKGHSFEIAQFRQDSETSDGRKPDSVKIVGSFYDDAARRDFTINAMGIDKDGNIIDHFDGVKDIKNKVLKTVGDPVKRFGEDYLRIMRLGRFSAKLGFDIEPETAEAAKELSGKISSLSVERIKDEIFKAAEQSGEKFARYIVTLDKLNILDVILPEISKLKQMPHNIKHHPEGNVWEHTLEALKVNKVLDPIVNFAILLHDIGKTVTLAWKEGNPTYYGHAEEGIELIDKIADRLRLSNDEKEKVIYAASNHMRFHEILHMKPSKIVKLVSDDNFDILVAVAKADNQSRMHMSSSEKEFEEIVNKAIEIKEKWGKKTASNIIKLVDGNHVMELTGLKPGPKVGSIIKQVTDWIIDNNIKNPEQIDNYIKELGK